MRKSILSAAVALLAIGATAGAQAQNVIANGDFELSNVATGGFENFANISATQGWNNLQWGSYSGTSSIVDVAGDQAARVNGGDVIWSAFQVTTAGDYELSFDAVGDGSGANQYFNVSVIGIIRSKCQLLDPLTRRNKAACTRYRGIFHTDTIR